MVTFFNENYGSCKDSSHNGTKLTFESTRLVVRRVPT